MVIQGGDDFIVRGRVEDFLDLLEEGLSIQLSSGDECIFSEKNMLTSQGGIEVFVE